MSSSAKTFFPYAVANCVCLLTFNIAFLVIGIVLWKGDTSQFGQIIKQETQEWNTGAIVDMKAIVPGQLCPSGYEAVTGTFYGTQNYCSRLFNNNFVGSCSKRSGGSTRYGLPDSSVNEINNQFLCYKRDSSLTYHNLANSRSNFCPQQTCGSSGNKDKRFCVSGASTVCPLNGIFSYQNGSNITPTPSNQTTVTPLQYNWTA